MDGERRHRLCFGDLYTTDRCLCSVQLKSSLYIRTRSNAQMVYSPSVTSHPRDSISLTAAAHNTPDKSQAPETQRSNHPRHDPTKCTTTKDRRVPSSIYIHPQWHPRPIPKLPSSPSPLPQSNRSPPKKPSPSPAQQLQTTRVILQKPLGAK